MLSGLRAISLSLLLSITAVGLSGCGLIIEGVVDTTLAIVKIPFKVAGAAVDIVTGDDDDEDDDKEKDEAEPEAELQDE